MYKENKMKILTSYFSQLKKIDQTRFMPIGIAITPPRWYRGINYKKVAPTVDMLSLSENAYNYKFQKILDSLVPEEVVKELTGLSGGKDIVLLCFEKDRNRCHRKLVADWLCNSLGLQIKEWGDDGENLSLFPG